MKAAAPAIERSTCDSAAKLTTACGRCLRNSSPTSAASPMSPRTNTWRGFVFAGSRLPRLPAYVSLSRLTTGSSWCDSQSSTKLAPMKPAPPVTRIMRVAGRDFERRARGDGRGAILSSRPGFPVRSGVRCVVLAVPVDESGEPDCQRCRRCEAGCRAQRIDRRIRHLDVAGLHRQEFAPGRHAEKPLQCRDEVVERNGLMVADVV